MYIIPLKVQVPFDKYFKVHSLAEFHKVMTMELFMEHLAPTVWPPGERIGRFPCSPTKSEWKDWENVIQRLGRVSRG